mmetsp:Transcript_37450/g.112301  ORF Transcript_37450/g.112301 Transcript_37450/m.112301 type:complete len:411 (-) Transcript_37450:1631-2863(-)
MFYHFSLCLIIYSTHRSIGTQSQNRYGSHTSLFCLFISPRTATSSISSVVNSHLLLFIRREALLEFLLDIRGDKVIISQLHGVVRPSLGHTSQTGHVLEHVRQGDLGRNGLGIAPLSQITNKSSAGVDVSNNVTHVLLGGSDVDLHEGFHKPRLGLAQSLPGSSAAGNFECHNRRINVMVGTINETSLHSQNGETSNDSRSENRRDAFLNTRDVLLGDGPSLDVSLELEVHAVLISHVLGDELELDTCVLTGSTRLLLVGVIDLGLLCDGLAVRDLGGANIGLDIELALHAIDNDLEVELTHTLNNSLPGLLITRETEGRILLREADEGVSHLLLISFGLGLNSDLDDGLGEVHLLENDSIIFHAESLASGGVLEANKGDDVASHRRLDLSTVVGVHLQHAANTLILPLH